MADEVLGGFDHTRYQDEVIERWGQDAWGQGDTWWRSLSTDDKKAFQQQQLDIAADFGTAHAAGLTPTSDEVQAIAHRHYQWITVAWHGKKPTAAQFTGLGQLYVDDPRFTKNYDKHGDGTAALIHAAMTAYANHNL